MTSARASETEAGTDEPHPDRWRILAVTLVIGFMALLDITIVNVAIPSIQTGLDASPQAVQWVVSGYALTFGLTLVTGGRLGDAYGRRLLLLVGLAGFVGASAAVGLAPNEELVVSARLVQGAAAGLLTPQNSGLIQQLFRGSERGVAFGYFGTTVGVASATGPILGGGIISLVGPEHGWRYIFLVNVPIGIFAFAFVWLRVPRSATSIRERSSDVQLDPVGALLLGGVVLCVLLPLVEAMSGAGPFLLLVLAAPVLAYAFARWEHRLVTRGRAPLLDVGLLRRTPGYAAGTALGTLYFSGFTGVFLVLSIFLQQAAGYSALQTGLLLTPFALGTTVSAQYAGRLVSRIGRKITIFAIGVMITGILALLLLLPGRVDDLSWPLLTLPLLVAGLGGGAVVAPNLTLSLAEVPPAMGGAAGAALQTGQRIGSALGAAVLVTAYRLALGANDATAALQVSLGCSVALLAAALGVAVLDQRRR